MDITFPIDLTYANLATVLRTHAASLHGAKDEEYTIDWRAVQWVQLPEILSVLAWSTRLTHLHRRVTWRLPNPLARLSETEEIRFWARTALGDENFDGVANRIKNLRHQVLHRNLPPGTRRAAIKAIKEFAFDKAREKTQAVARWIDVETSPFNAADVLGYFRRYKVLERAVEAGIRLTPNPADLSAAALGVRERTPCLELTSIHSTHDVNTLSTLPKVLQHPDL